MQISGIRTHITIGKMQVLRCPRCVIRSVRHRPLSTADITLPDAAGELYRGLMRGDAVQIQLGYRGQQSAIWNGTVQYLGQMRNKDQIVVRAVDTALPLTTTRLTQVWENETPEAIVAYIIGQAGLSVGRIDSIGTVLPKVIASDIPVWQLVRQIAVSCQSSLGLDMSSRACWLGADGVNWGDFDEPGNNPVIATGAGLLAHEPAIGSHGRGVVACLLQPGLLHSCRFGLKDLRRGIDKSCRAQEVEHIIEPGKARTYLRYGAEYAWV
jgi:hypothetical protein